MEITSRPAVPIEIDALLRSRFHGAVSIRGIRFQILFSALAAFRLYESDGPQTIRLEGIEDVDLVGLSRGDEFIQVKTADRHWSWSQLKKPIGSFLEAMRTGEFAKFILVFNFRLEKEFARLSRRNELTAAELNRVTKKFRKLCRSCGATRQEADNLLEHVTIESHIDSDVTLRMRQLVATEWDVPTESVDLYLCVLVSQFLEWAVDRKSVSADDLSQIRTRVAEGMARERAFDAYGRGLITRLTATCDTNAEEFFIGKGTRVGQIAAGVDVPRPIWISRIREGMRDGQVCVIRAPSGQGKSALLYRFVIDHWVADSTYELKVAETVEQAELVCEFLRFRSDLKLPTNVVIDNAGWRTAHWPRVAELAASLRIPVLVSTRHEDWYRFGVESLTGTVFIEPELTQDEARSIYAALERRGHVRESVTSGDQAFEQVGEPRLLMEFIYLVTQGRMLRERLRDQISSMERRHDDPSRLDILRLVSLAHILGVPVDVRRLMSEVACCDDQQRTLESVQREFVEVSPGEISGLHHVRSAHLVDLLHATFPEASDTAARLLRVVPYRALGTLVANALRHDAIQRAGIFDAIVATSCDLSIQQILDVLAGVFHAGERTWLLANRNVFRNVRDHIGAAAADLVSYRFLPVTVNDAWKNIEQLLQENPERLDDLNALLDRVEPGERGLDWCRQLIDRLQLASECLTADEHSTAELLIWSAQSGATLQGWDDARPHMSDALSNFNRAPDEFCEILEGVSRYDTALYEDWFAAHGEKFLAWFRHETDTYRIELSDNQVEIEYFVDPTNALKAGQQTMSRLRLLRRVLPTCNLFICQGNWMLPGGVQPSVDDTAKRLSPDTLPYETDTRRNSEWANIVLAEFFPKFSWSIQESWSVVRTDALQLASELTKALSARLAGRRHDSAYFNDGTVFQRIIHTLLALPRGPNIEALGPTVNLSRDIADFLREKSPHVWASAFMRFVQFLCQHLENPTTDTARLTRVNFRACLDEVANLHCAFDALLQHSPDYFEMRALNDQEMAAYESLLVHLQAWIGLKLKVPVTNVRKMVLTKHEQLSSTMLNHIRRALIPLEDLGIHVRVGTVLTVPHREHELTLQVREVPVSYSVADISFPEESLDAIATALTAARESADRFWLLPEWNSTRFLDGAYHLSSIQLYDIEQGRELGIEALVPSGVPDYLSMDGIPEFPVVTPPHLQLRTDILAMGQLARQIKARHESVLPLAASRFDWDRQIYEQSHARHCAMSSEFPSVCDDIRSRMEAMFDGSTSHEDFVLLDSILQLIKLAAEGGLESLLAEAERIPSDDILIFAFTELARTKSWA